MRFRRLFWSRAFASRPRKFAKRLRLIFCNLILTLKWPLASDNVGNTNITDKFTRRPWREMFAKAPLVRPIPCSANPLFGQFHAHNYAIMAQILLRLKVLNKCWNRTRCQKKIVAERNIRRLFNKIYLKNIHFTEDNSPKFRITVKLKLNARNSIDF